MDEPVKFNESAVFSEEPLMTFFRSKPILTIGGLVTINVETGEHIFGPNYTPDEAAKIFWQAVTCMKASMVQLGKS